jgi:LPXTG-motif cell wall-anchored protein
MNNRKSSKVLAVLVGLVPVGVVLDAGSTSAAPTQGVVDCGESDYPPSDYPPAPECTTSTSSSTTTTSSTTPSEEPLQVELLSSVCDGDVPYLMYRVIAPGSSATTVSITFVNPNGSSYVVKDLPLSGRILWPGAVVDASGNPVDWPGWSQQADGTWVPSDEWNWVRPQVTVLLEVNPSATRVVGYPPASPQCVAGPRTPGGQAFVLPETGSDTIVPLTAGAVATLFAGAALTIAARRRSAA